CRIQGEMFEATAALGGLEIQLVYYRGFSECKASRWMTTAADLHRVMRSVFCVGGETQIERLLLHAIAETRRRKVNALVLVGDALSNRRICDPRRLPAAGLFIRQRRSGAARPRPQSNRHRHRGIGGGDVGDLPRLRAALGAADSGCDDDAGAGSPPHLSRPL